MRRRRRSSLLGTVGRTAVVAGTAQAAAGRVHRSQQQRWAAEAAPAPAPPAAAPTESAPAADRMALLQQLGELRSQGVLTDAEFEAEKAKVLAS